MRVLMNIGLFCWNKNHTIWLAGKGAQEQTPKNGFWKREFTLLPCDKKSCPGKFRGSFSLIFLNHSGKPKPSRLPTGILLAGKGRVGVQLVLRDRPNEPVV